MQPARIAADDLVRGAAGRRAAVIPPDVRNRPRAAAAVKTRHQLEIIR
jgi:hypothetical protein